MVYSMKTLFSILSVSLLPLSISDAYTFKDLADSAAVADSLAGFSQANPEMHAKLESDFVLLRRTDSLTARPQSFSDLLKRPMTASPGPIRAKDLEQSVERIKDVFINDLRPRLDSAGVSEERSRSLRKPITEFQTEDLKLAMDRNDVRLSRFRQKFGPGAPRLNVLEVGFAYLLQGVPGFGPGPKGPGPLEPVCAYSTSYVMVYNGADIPGQLMISSAWETGLRWYWFGASDSPYSFWSLLKPSYLSIGAAFSSRREWFFLAHDEAWDPGFFVDIGGFKSAVLFGDEIRVFLGRQFQLVPYLF